ncbi:hypothetical protein G6O69_22665 [Pseudenhygromyxa sp. WMMC2535]|uniref:hypothetical protein n=1 Tax=Pseudenhygromyxa sp. WMMC2535 TaxID=2712867 RepID=UPI001552A627|nr:hypothetical protein [Pseudenhygromyxa sp. WMMC2535]NVB40659.1 hypothetical protein [Pseudenhygromyxa sp. WMMC2535]
MSALSLTLLAVLASPPAGDTQPVLTAPAPADVDADADANTDVDASADADVDAPAADAPVEPAPAPAAEPPAPKVEPPPEDGDQIPPLEPADEPTVDMTKSPVGPAGSITYVEANDPAQVYDGGVQWTFGKRGQNSLRMITWHQLWNRYTHLNPGSEVSGNPREHQYDVGLRRSRVLFLGNIADRFQILMHFGINNQTFNNARKPQLFVHDATAQLRVFRDYIWVGGGLHYWKGISRMTNASTLTMLGIDAPILNWPTIEKSDQFARNLGVYVKGKIGMLDYRVALNKPFVPGATVDETVEAPVMAADYDPHNNTVELAGYFNLQFFDRESNSVPFTVGTYLGSKRVLNVGAGVQWHPKAMWYQDTEGVEYNHDLFAFGGDIFADIPFDRQRGALTVYGVYYYYDFGPNHLRNVGIMNVATGGTTSNGAGNAYPVIGTGHHTFAQLGYMLPQNLLGVHRLQPYVSGQLSKFEALDQLAFVPEVGINWYLLSHHVKLTMTYRNRPVFDSVEVDGETEQRQSVRRSEAILQAQIFF